MNEVNGRGVAAAQAVPAGENDQVGPVLEGDGQVVEAIIAAIREAHPDVTVLDRGGYLRVLVPHRCVVRRVAVERALGRAFRLPGDLELVMPSFKGAIDISHDQVIWEWQSERTS
jgi:toluene monooxygenase system protein D